MQIGTHVPPLQEVLEVFVVAQDTPHEPQWLVSVLVLTSQPLLSTVSQLAWSVPQPSNTQPLLAQCPVALGNAVLQSVPGPVQAPQWLELLEVLISQPSATVPLQSKFGAVHDLI